jgi:hypothetical protein
LETRIASSLWLCALAGGLVLGPACGPPHVRRPTAGEGLSDGGGGTAGAPVSGAAGFGSETGGGAGGKDGRLLDSGAPADGPAGDAPRDALVSRDQAGDASDAQGAGDTSPGADARTSEVDLLLGLMGYWKLDEGMGNTTEDSSGRGNPGALTNMPVWDVNTPFAGSARSLLLNGTSSYVAMRNDLAPVLGGTATLAFWIRTTQTGSDTAYVAPGVTGADQPAGTNDVFWGYLDARGAIGIACGDGTSVRSDPVNDDRWHHLAFTRDKDSGRAQVFVDGNLVRAGATAAGTKSTPITALGRISGSTNHYFKGSLDEVRMWNRILGSAEVAAAARP